MAVLAAAGFVGVGDVGDVGIDLQNRRSLKTVEVEPRPVR